MYYQYLLNVTFTNLLKIQRNEKQKYDLANIGFVEVHPFTMSLLPNMSHHKCIYNRCNLRLQQSCTYNELLAIMKQNQHYFKTIAHIDLRNAKFQGFVNDKQQRHGFGILFDDDLTLYFSEWQHDQLDGKTLILRIDGSVLFGQFKNNNIYRTILFKNNDYTILSNFKDDKSQGLSAAFDRNMANALIFDTCEITNRKTAEKSFYNRFIPLKEIRKQKETIHKTAENNNIEIATFEVQFLQFLRMYKKKYERHLAIIKKQAGEYYFGFKNGIGFQFSLAGSVHQKIQIQSMGVYSKLRLLQVGVKNHKRRCFQQGRFNIKQTISYSNLLERPQKCKQMHRNIHKQSLGYLSEYFYLKDNFLEMFDEFIYRKLQQQFHEAVTRCRQRNNFLMLQKSPKKQDIIDLQTNRNKVIKNQSYKNLTNRNKQGRDNSGNDRSLFNKGAKKDRSQQQIKKSSTKSASFLRSRSPTDVKSKKQLYINNYKIIRQNSQTSQQLKNANHSKQKIRQNTTLNKQPPSPLKDDQKSVKGTNTHVKNQSLLKEEKDMDKNTLTRINQQKIRQQLYFNEMKQKYHFVQRSPPLINQLYRPNCLMHQINGYINKNLLSSKHKKDVEFQNQKTSIDFMVHFEQIEKRRANLLADYRNLNSSSPNQRSIDNLRKYHNQITEIKQFTLIQTPISHKENKNEQPQYSDRFRSRIDNFINKGKVR